MFEESEEGAAFSYYKALPEKLQNELNATISEIINVWSGFSSIYNNIKNSSQYFSFQLYQLGDPFADRETNGYFLIQDGTETRPHVIRFQPNHVSYGIETTVKRHSTVFEELYHASEFLIFGKLNNMIVKETDVKVSKAFVYYINGGYIGEGNLKNQNLKKLPYKWTYQTDVWSQSFLYYYFNDVVPYFKLKNEKKTIPPNVEAAFRNAVKEFGRTHVYNKYNKHISEQEKNKYFGETPYFDQLFK